MADPKCEIITKYIFKEEELPRAAYDVLLTDGFTSFLAELVAHFDAQLSELEVEREQRYIQIKAKKYELDFPTDTKDIREGTWKIDELPAALKDRRVDLGDVDAAETESFLAALTSGAQAVQVDFDDGFCPEWKRVMKAHYNTYLACHGLLKNSERHYSLSDETGKCSYIMFRPRALNMIERNVLVNGKRIHGALFDFALFLYFNGEILHKAKKGPFLYLSKLEAYKEAKLWDEIFEFSEKKLSLPYGTIKACVLIESLTAVFQMDEILYHLRHHSAGLNCGLWDYSASFIARLGHAPEQLFPDRTKYVTMEQHFLSSYRRLLVSICHRRGAPATGGMFAGVSEEGNDELLKTLTASVVGAKRKEALAGADGALVYDLKFIKPVQDVFTEVFANGGTNQIDSEATIKLEKKITKDDLLSIPKGDAIRTGLQANIEVGINYIYSWMCRKGHFVFKGKVEDSATAEISRCQVWQQIHHASKFEDGGANTQLGDEDKGYVTAELVRGLITSTVNASLQSGDLSKKQEELFTEAGMIFWDLCTARNCPLFFTTYLEEQRVLQVKDI